MTPFLLVQLRSHIVAALVFLASCNAALNTAHDLSEFACPGEAKVMYYETGSLITLPSKRMKGLMHLGYGGECVPQIKFPKSTGNFAGSGKTNNFVAYFEGQLQFPAFGAWILFTISQDGSKLYIEDELVVNNNGLHNVMVEKNGTIDVAESLIKNFRLEYFKGEEGGNGLIMKWEGPGMDKTVVKSKDFYVPDQLSLIGLPAYIVQTDFVNTTRYATASRNSLPVSFDALVPFSKDYKYESYWPRENCDLTDNYAVVLDGYALFPKAGEYIITETSDDDARMYVDGQLVLSVNGRTGFRDIGQASISITEGGTIKRIRLEFLELCLGGVLDLTWMGPNITKGTPVQFVAMQDR
jgi:hypothetical protein